MSREIRRVPKDWAHPKDNAGNYIPLLDDATLLNSLREWDEGMEAWDRGEFPEFTDDDDHLLPFAEWAGERPDPADYMPAWGVEATHLQMYESTSEGTPISPVFETPEQVARWCADNKASAFAGQPAAYEHWLRVARGGFAPTAVMTVGQDGCSITSGVESFRTKAQ